MASAERHFILYMEVGWGWVMPLKLKIYRKIAVVKVEVSNYDNLYSPASGRQVKQNKRNIKFKF